MKTHFFIMGLLVMVMCSCSKKYDPSRIERIYEACEEGKSVSSDDIDFLFDQSEILIDFISDKTEAYIRETDEIKKIDIWSDMMTNSHLDDLEKIVGVLKVEHRKGKFNGNQQERFMKLYHDAQRMIKRLDLM